MFKPGSLKILILLSFLISGIAANAQHEWENSIIFDINKEPAHASFVPIDEEGVPNFDKTASPYVQLLNGYWKFNWAPKPADRPVDFYTTSYDVSAWKEIQVPANWQFTMFLHGKKFRCRPTGNCRDMESRFIQILFIRLKSILHLFKTIITRWALTAALLLFPKNGMHVKYFSILQA